MNLENIKKDFPILFQTINEKPFVYLDSAATSQKPKAVVEAMQDYYYNYNANIHRGLYTISVKATEAYEKAREKTAKFINAPHSHEVIFTRGTTESINLVARTWGQQNISEQDTILLTEMEHHSNLVPWHILKKNTGVNLRFIPVKSDGTLDISNLDQLLQGVKLVSLVHVSNTLGTINPVKKIVSQAHAAGAKVLIDGAQAVPHLAVDVQDIGCDFYAFSGHKMCASTGVGVLWGKEDILNAMPPFLGGGEMIDEVSLDESTYAPLPNKFEAGTMNICEAISLGVAIDYLSQIGMDNIRKHEQQITNMTLEKLSLVKGLQVIGLAPERSGVISFVMNKIHPHDISTILDYEGVAIRAGHHCTQPLMKKFAISATARASFYFYNTEEDIDRFIASLQKVKEIFRNVT